MVWLAVYCGVGAFTVIASYIRNRSDEQARFVLRLLEQTEGNHIGNGGRRYDCATSLL